MIKKFISVNVYLHNKCINQLYNNEMYGQLFIITNSNLHFH